LIFKNAIPLLVCINDSAGLVGAGNEAARRLAEATLKEGGEPPAVIAKMAQRVLLRPLSAAEAEVVVQTENDLEQQFAGNLDSTKAFLAIGESKADPALPAPRLAALTMVASQLLNLDEALNK
jgi:hypothetical protein